LVPFIDNGEKALEQRAKRERKRNKTPSILGTVNERKGGKERRRLEGRTQGDWFRVCAGAPPFLTARESKVFGGNF
jgi:hypothetical protein